MAIARPMAASKETAFLPAFPGKIRFALAGIAFLIAAATLNAQPWRSASARYRLRIEGTKNTPGATMGSVQVWPCGINVASCAPRVFNARGDKVSSQILWAGIGEPVKLIFDISGGGAWYEVYLEEGGSGGELWQPQSGLILETRKLKAPGRPEKWDQIWKILKGCTLIQGRSLVPNIFHGINPHGPTEDFAAHYTGHFIAKQAGEYEFAVVSGDVTFLRIDGKVVAVRPANANGRGSRGTFNGKITLKEGRHQLDYVALHGGGEFIGEAAWKPPGRDRFEVMPREAFVPVEFFRTVSIELAPGLVPRLYFEWENWEQNMVEGLALVNVRLRALGRGGQSYRWRFDDGTEAKGDSVMHLFPRPGVRRVSLEALEGTRRAGEQTEFILVAPQWQQREEWREGLFQQQKKDLLGRNWSAASWEDLAFLVNFAHRIDDHQLLAQVGAFCMQRPNESSARSHGETFFKLGAYLQNSDIRDYASAEKAWRAALTFTQGELQERTKVRLAQFLIEFKGKADEALGLLKSVNVGVLAEQEKRRWQLLQGDAWLAKGNVEECRKCYAAAGSELGSPDSQKHVLHGAHLQSAKDFVLQGEFDEAERLLKQTEWESPEERLSLNAGLALMKIYLGRKENARALYLGQRLLNVATVDTLRADLLYYLVEANLALKDQPGAQEVLAKLLKEHPYSEAAAKAKDRWKK